MPDDRNSWRATPNWTGRVPRTASDFHAQSYRDLHGERVRLPRPSPLRRLLADLAYLAVGALLIGGMVGLFVLFLDWAGL